MVAVLFRLQKNPAREQTRRRIGSTAKIGQLFKFLEFYL